jgi:hypothetical protein
MSREGMERLRHAARYLPLLDAWRADGPAGEPPLTPLEADVVTVALEALDAGRPTALAQPGGRSRLPLLTAVAAAADPLVRPQTPRRPGAVAFVTRSAFRRAELEALDVAAAPVAPALEARRLRSDGYVCRSGGGGVGVLGAENYLLFVSPLSGLVTPRGGPIRAVIIDDTDDPEGGLITSAVDWADQLDAVGIAFTHLTARPPSEWSAWPIDWSYLAEGGLADGLESASTAASGAACSLVVPDNRVAPLFRARATLARLGERAGPWPVPLAAAARFARILIDLSVPADLYDAHVPGTIARSLTRRREDLDTMAPSALDGPWRDVAETDWALLKADLCTAHDALVEVNHKANALGLAVEELLAADEVVDVLCPTGVAASATRTWLLEGGFAGCTDAFAAGRLDVRAIGETRLWNQHRSTVLPGMTAHRHRHRITDGDIGRLVVCSYPPEAARLHGELDRLLNADRAANAAARNAALTAIFGAAGLTVPGPVPVSVTSSDATIAAELEPADFVDVADAAALSSELLDDLDDGDGGEPIRSRGLPWVQARALIVAPAAGGAPVGLLVRESATLDRVNQGRVSPVRSAALAPGMLLVGITGEHRHSIFGRLRPHLDVLHGPGTRLWLDLWEQALLQALRRKGSVNALGDAIRAAGAAIRDPAIAAWPSPYRIGPKDPRNVRRVAEVAGVPVVALNADKITAVMRAVRRRHRDIGVKLSTALRAAAAGRADAFDRLEAQLGVAVTELLGDITPWKVLSVSEVGWTRPTDLWRPLAPAAAHQAFHPNRPKAVMKSCDPEGELRDEETR